MTVLEKSQLCDIYTVIPEEVREDVRAVAMDISAAMEKAYREKMPAADVIYDKFHIEKHLSDAMGKVRAGEHKKLLAEGVPIFKRTRYLLLRRRERWSVKQRAQYSDIKREFGATQFSQSRIRRMWAAKESFRPFWHNVSVNLVEKVFPALVLLGDAQSHPGTHPGREDDQSASRQYFDIFPSRNFQCVHRRDDFENPRDQIRCSRFQEY